MLSPASCERIIQLCDQQPDWDDGKVEPVDGCPEYQINLLDSDTHCEECNRGLVTEHPVMQQCPELKSLIEDAIRGAAELVEAMTPPGIELELHRAFVKR